MCSSIDCAIINVDEMTRLFSESVTGLVAYGNGAFIFARKELIMEAYDKPFLTYDEQIDCLNEPS